MWPDEGSAMTTDEPASTLPSASLPTTPSSMRAPYTIGTKSHAYTPPTKPSLQSRSNSKILHATSQDTLTCSSGQNGQESIGETRSLTNANGTSGEATELATPVSGVGLGKLDPDLTAVVAATTAALVDPSTGSSSSSAALTEAPPPPLPSSFATSAVAPGPPGSTPSSSSASSSPKRASIIRAASMKQQQTSSGGDPVSGLPPSTGLSRHASLTLNSRRKADRGDSIGNLSLVPQQQQQQLPSPSPSPQTAQAQRHHRMLHRQSQSSLGHHSASTSISSSIGLPDDVADDLVPGTPTSISSFSSHNSERDKGANGRLRSNRNSVALIENRNINALSSNLAMIQSPTKSEFGQPSAIELLSVIAQKEARIQQLREDLETNLQELSQLKEQWSKMMIEERNRQQVEANASIQQENGASVSSIVSNRLSTAAIWGSVVGSVSQLSGASSGLSIHHISTHAHTATGQTSTQGQGASTPTQTQSSHVPNGVASGRSSTSSIGRTTAGGGAEGNSNPSNASRPTSPLPAYLSGFSGLHGTVTPSSPLQINSPKDSHLHHHVNGHARKGGDRTSLSSQSTVSSLTSNGGDVPRAFEPGHSHTSSIGSGSVLSTSPSSATGPHTTTTRDSRERQRPKRESSGMFIPVEAEEVLVNTGRALFKGFGSLIGGIRTVVNDVAESDRFQHSRQRTMDMMNGLAQSAADVLPLPSQDEIYYHHQRLQLLDEEAEAEDDDDDQGDNPARVQQRRERAKERLQRRLQQQQHQQQSKDSALRRSSSSQRSAGLNKDRSKSPNEDDDISRSVDLLGIHDAPVLSKSLSPTASSSSLLGVATGDDDDEEAHNWDLDLGTDQDLLKMLETTTTTTTTTTITTATNDTPLLPTVAASKKDD